MKMAKQGKFRQGDIIWMDCNPQSGHEQAGRRPALIVSKTRAMEVMGSLAMVCPITNTDNGNPLHIKLPEGSGTTGHVMCEQVKALDIGSRNAEYKDRLWDEEILWTVLDTIQSFFDRD